MHLDLSCINLRSMTLGQTPKITSGSDCIAVFPLGLRQFTAERVQDLIVATPRRCPALQPTKRRLVPGYQRSRAVGELASQTIPLPSNHCVFWSCCRRPDK